MQYAMETTHQIYLKEEYEVIKDPTEFRIFD